MASTRLTKTWSSSGNRNKWTWSSWVKRSNISNTNRIFGVYQNAQYSSTCYISSGGNFVFIDTYNSSEQAKAVTNMKLRDTNGWYHLVVTYDKDNATSADKLILYVNGERVSLSSYTAPSQATTWNVDSLTMEIGAFNSADYFDGLMSHVHFCDGYAYSASDFGSTDSTTGQWKINVNPSVSYGTNGFFLFNDNASVTDQSGNSNNWTASGTLTQTEDNPSNNFPTFGNGQIIPNNSTNSFSKGGLTASNSSAIWQSEVCPFGFSAGKYYWEMKLVHNGGDPRGAFGIMNSDTGNINQTGNNSLFGSKTGFYGYQSGGSSNGKSRINGVNSLTNLTNFDATDGTIIGFAIDCDNKRMYLHVNGTYEHSGNPSAGTGFEDCSTGWTTGDTFLPCFTTHNLTLHFNFGNGYFGATAISSEGTNASGLGKFEYDVPTGFTALCTKGLNE